MQIALASFLIGNSTLAFADPQLQSETKFLNNKNYTEANCNLNKAAYKNCLNAKNSYKPKDKLDEYIIKGVTYSTKFVPLMNDGAEGSEYTSIMTNDFKKLLVDAGFDLANSTANSQIQKIPFFAQTNFNIAGGSESDTSFSINSLMKLGELAKDEEGDLKTLAFSQARFATATNADGSTFNLGLGIRNRPNDISMVGANAFWDYRMTDYSDAHSRLGLGGEYFWKDFEFRNNWYMAITDEKNIFIKGVEFKERVVDGWDVEVGYRLPNYPQFGLFVRGFNWDYKYKHDNTGLEGALSWQATPNIGLEAFVSNEISAASTTQNANLPGTDETFFGFRINLTGNPVKFEKANYKQNMITQLIQPVKREYDVLLERKATGFSLNIGGS